MKDAPTYIFYILPSTLFNTAKFFFLFNEKNVDYIFIWSYFRKKRLQL